MNEGIVEILRKYADRFDDDDIAHEMGMWVREAADAIELLRVDRDRWRSAAGIMYEQVFQLKRLNELQVERIEKALWAYNKAYNEG